MKLFENQKFWREHIIGSQCVNIWHHKHILVYILVYWAACAIIRFSCIYIYIYMDTARGVIKSRTTCSILWIYEYMCVAARYYYIWNHKNLKAVIFEIRKNNRIIHYAPYWYYTMLKFKNLKLKHYIIILMWWYCELCVYHVQ